MRIVIQKVQSASITINDTLYSSIKKGLLYLGTENALYFSNDDGENWQSLMSNLPPSPMYWM